ncbi:hypothetical protein JL721_2729 [Aureococcus anophagefferens]|nr:hypothetical protein JL721_2729 [Aureococcus anophagefferens]
MGGESPVGAVVSAAEGGDGVQEPPPVPAPADAPAAAAPAAEERETVAVVDRTAGVQQCEELRGLSVAERRRLPRPVVRPVFEPGDARDPNPMLELKAPPVVFTRGDKLRLLRGGKMITARFFGVFEGGEAVSKQGKVGWMKVLLCAKTKGTMMCVGADLCKFDGKVERLEPTGKDRPGSPEAAEFFSAYETPRGRRARARPSRRRESAAKNWKKELVPAPSWTHVRDKLKAEDVRAACAAWDADEREPPGDEAAPLRGHRRPEEDPAHGPGAQGPAAGSEKPPRRGRAARRLRLAAVRDQPPGRQAAGGDGRGSGADGGYGRDRSSYGRDRSSYDGDGDRRGGDGRAAAPTAATARRPPGSRQRPGQLARPVPRGRDRNDDDRGSYGPPPRSRDSCGYDQGAMVVCGAGPTPRRRRR